MIPRFVAQSSTRKKNPLTELQGKHKKDKLCKVCVKRVVFRCRELQSFTPLDRLPRFVAQNTLQNQNPVKESGG